MGELTTLPNIAAKLEAQLADVGITTIEQLRQTGSREAWLRILIRDPSACIMRLSALEGAIQGIRWHDLDADTKERLSLGERVVGVLKQDRSAPLSVEQQEYATKQWATDKQLPLQ